MKSPRNATCWAIYQVLKCVKHKKCLLDAEERILSAEYDTKMCEISLLQLSGKVTQYLK